MLSTSVWPDQSSHLDEFNSFSFVVLFPFPLPCLAHLRHGHVYVKHTSGDWCFAEDEASRCKRLPCRAAFGKLCKKRLVFTQRCSGFLLVTCVVEEQHSGSKTEKHFNNLWLLHPYCTQRPLKQLRKYGCHLPCWFYEFHSLMSFSKKW